MYIQPNSTIKILENIPLNKSYEHTVYYPDKDTQYNAFNKYTKFTLTRYSYQRANLGTVKVELKYEDVYKCNYLMFKNESFEGKWFYAFITGCSYISNNTTAIYYDLDVMQSWCYDYQFRGTFVERQHSTNDIPYENTQPEGLEIGDTYLIQSNNRMNLITNDSHAFVILGTTGPNGERPSATTMFNMLMSLYISSNKSDDEAKQIISSYIANGLEDNIISIYTVPKDASINKNLFVKRPLTIDGYTPKNKKLYNFPYSYIQMYNNLGEVVELHYENFTDSRGNSIHTLDNQMTFTANTTDVPIPQSKLRVANYQGTIGYDYNFYCVNYSQFPTGAFSGNSFQVWLAQNKNAYGASLNAIRDTFDTNVSIAQNNYTMAGLSASTTRTNEAIQNSTMMSTAVITADSQRASLNTSRTQSGESGLIGIGQGITTGGGIGLAAAGIVGGLPAATMAAGGAAIGALTSVAKTGIEQQGYNAQEAVIKGQEASARLTAVNNAGIADNTYDTAMKNAELSRTNAHLSAINTYQNAINALVAKKQDAQHQPSNLHGAMMNDIWNCSIGNVGFTVSCKCIKREYAEVIDTYFDRYGYAQRRMYTPQRINRSHWSYLKTVGCNIVGNLNNSDLITIKAIYDNGITTWHTLEEVGNYDLDNTIK